MEKEIKNERGPIGGGLTEPWKEEKETKGPIGGGLTEPWKDEKKESGPIGGGLTEPWKKAKEAIVELTKKPMFKSVVMIAPFIMLGVTALATIFRAFGWYSDVYLYLSQIMGYSILTNLFFLSYGAKHKFCSYSLISILSLLFLNVSNIIAMLFGLVGSKFYVVFDCVLIIGLFALAFSKLLKKCK